jgi:NAD(P)-dependent dehydrogenase (short-subunit alcohol dehydrogenase family)
LVRIVLAVRLSAITVRCDVMRDEDVKAALDKTVETFGRLDFVFNSPAGNKIRSKGKTKCSTSISVAPDYRSADSVWAL